MVDTAHERPASTEERARDNVSRLKGPLAGESAAFIEFHSASLLIWLAAALAPSALTRNPYYLTIALAMIAIAHWRLARRSPTADAWAGFAKLSAFFVLFAMLSNVLLGGVGQTKLVTLPALKWRNEAGATLFQIGGPVTLESVIYSLNAALALFAVIAALATFNVLANHYRLLRALPPFLYQAGAAVSIALTFMPQIFRAQREIREARALRGYQGRGVRHWAPFATALLAEGLERAMALAESMEARGFSSPPGARRQTWFYRLLVACGLILVLFGALAPALWPSALGWPVSLAGAALIAATLWRIGRANRRTRYRRELWRGRDTILTACGAVAIAILAAWRLADPAAFVFQPFPKAGWPPFNPLLATPLLFIATPIFLAGDTAGERAT